MSAIAAPSVVDVETHNLPLQPLLNLFRLLQQLQLLLHRPLRSLTFRLYSLPSAHSLEVPIIRLGFLGSEAVHARIDIFEIKDFGVELGLEGLGEFVERLEVGID